MTAKCLNAKRKNALFAIVPFWLTIALILASLAQITSCQRDEAQQIFDRGLTLWETKKYDESIQNFIALTKAFPEHHLVDDSLFWIANIYEHYLKDSKQAVRFYRSLTIKFESSDYYLKSMVGLARVRALEGDEGKRKAIRIYRKLQKKPAIHEGKEWTENQLQLAGLFFDLKQFKQARIELKRLIVEKPQSKLLPRAYYKLGRSYYLEGKIDLARITFLETEQKYKFQKASLDSAINLADIYEESGELESAIKVYQTILNRLEEKEVYYQMAVNRMKKLRSRLRKTITG
jgi:TolA-binding protein